MNKVCHQFAVPLFYRDLVLHAWDTTGCLEKFLEDIKQLRKGGLGEKYTIHARNVKIWDSSPSLFVVHNSYEELPSDNRKVIRYRKEWVEEFENIPMPKDPDSREAQPLAVWETLAAALKSFKKLYNLIWVCQKKFPPCLLDAIHTKHTDCLLHLRTFLPRQVSKKGIEHPYDLDLIKSPNLHSITFKLPRTNHRNTPEELKRVFDWHEIAALQLVATAPNVKHVNIVTGFEKSSGVLYPNYISKLGRGRENLWESKKKTSLTSLIFNRWRLMQLDDIKEWLTCIKLSDIRHLVLGHVSDPQVLSSLAEKAGHLPLETFGITLVQTTNQLSLIHELARLVHELRYLKDLRLAGYHLGTSLFDEVIEWHGPNLRRLTLSPLSKSELISSREIMKIERHCHQLHFLKMTIEKPAANTELSGVCPNLDALQELSLQISGIAEDGLPGKIEDTIRQQKRTRLHYLKIWDDVVSDRYYTRLVLRFLYNPILTSHLQKMFYFNSNRPTHSSDNSSKPWSNGSSLPSIEGNRNPIFIFNEGAPPSWMIETELTEVFQGLPTAKFREGEPIYPWKDHKKCL
ncbi:hypothetical protein EYB25_002124 [Talaromyces marneffei]|uniref:uncharacterized protein n=1 Tax=Talaromyces marneffei TaxID=37727 RepID=UPI0012A8EF24|nr:uncharacterized protein EYB26_000210 [Talaromyces marneffei]KAE8557417.1 hypothetical protein EYB25_002124 [Talaromyces marneffei]QGA12566.1 hypothetical protein EYB26_000210 [Talaromyces marneffei]